MPKLPNNKRHNKKCFKCGCPIKKGDEIVSVGIVQTLKDHGHYKTCHLECYERANEFISKNKAVQVRLDYLEDIRRSLITAVNNKLNSVRCDLGQVINLALEQEKTSLLETREDMPVLWSGRQAKETP